MNFETSMFLLAGMIVAFPILFGIPRLVNWITGRKIIPLWIPFLILIGSIIGGSLYLDAAGEVRTVSLVDKKEEIRYRRNGGWNRLLSLSINYPGTASSFTLSCDAETFDAVRVGQTIEARVFDLGPWFRFARLKDRSTFSFLTSWFHSGPSGPSRQGTAAVQEVHHVTEYVVRARRHNRYQIPWPYDVIEFAFTPPGRSAPVIAVDSIEVGSLAGQAGFTKGAPLQVAWPEDDPRSAKIVGGRPARPWMNWVYSLSTVLVPIGVILALAFTYALFRKRKKAPAPRPRLP